MNRIILSITLLIITSLSYNHAFLYAWDDQITHKALTEQAALKSVLHRSYGNYLPNIGFFDIDEILHWDNKACDDETGETECTIKEWLRYGAEKEDEEIWFHLN